MSAPLFEIDGLHAAGDGGDVLAGVDLTIGEGEVHALVGPGGSGAATLAAALLGGPECEVVAGSIRFHGEDITAWSTDIRAKAGIFLAFSDPEEIPGVSVLNLLRQALSARSGPDPSMHELTDAITRWTERLDMAPSPTAGSPNDGRSGGDRKRSEMLQMAILEPEVAILDETASDTAGRQVVANGVREVHRDRPQMGVLVIAHDPRLLEELRPDRVHVIVGGTIVESGGATLAEELVRDDYVRFEVQS